ncbi:MAG TPA: hypothetical protein VEO36_03285, partial [Casimicrobiaceae bacterium]|nr:hypothetical protein [Casimicrobiaceae bacterium]
MTRRVGIARALATSAMLALSSIVTAQLSVPLSLPKEAAPAEATSSATGPDPAARLGDVRATLMRLERPDAVAEGSPPG